MVAFSTNGSNGGDGSNGAVSVQGLHSTKLTKAQRAVLGAKALRGEVELKPTAKLIAAAVGCSVTYVQAAKKLPSEEQEAVNAGHRPLIEPKAKTAVMPDEISDTQLEALVQRAGVARMWDTLAKLLV